MPYTVQEMQVRFIPNDMADGTDFEYCRILDFQVRKPTSVQEYGEGCGWPQAQIDALIADRGEVFTPPISRGVDQGPDYSEGRCNTPIGALDGLPPFPLLRASTSGALLFAWTDQLEEIPAAERITGDEGMDASRRA